MRRKTIRTAADVAMLTPLPHSVAGLLTFVPATTQLDDMVLSTRTRARVDRILAEQAAAKRLAEAGFSPMRKLLLVGPPGVGKTMTASVLATSLDVPLLRVNIHAVIEGFLGATAGHLGKIFEHIRSTRAVYLFDEFDALAGARGGRETDVGEMRRATNSLLQFIELDDSASLLIAATNHADLIDGAMFRRFDDVIRFWPPTVDEAEALIQRCVSRFAANTSIDGYAVARQAAGIAHADLVAICRSVCKDAVLGLEEVSTTRLLFAVAAHLDARPEVSR